MDDITYSGPFGEQLEKFVSYKRSLGYSYHQEADRMKRFDQMTKSLFPNAEYITKEIANAWCRRQENESVSNQNGRVATIKQFSKYMAGIDNRTFVIQFKPGIVPKYKPYIFNHEEIRLFFAAADGMQFKSRPPLAHITYPLLFRVLYCCGMRISELCDLKVCNFNGDYFIIEHGKFGNGRIVPMNSVLSEMVDSYITKVHPSGNPEEWLFIDSFEGNRLYPTKVYDSFRDLLLRAGIEHGGQRERPTRTRFPLSKPS